MRWCTVQTNEYDLQGKTYPVIGTHHKLHNNNETNSRFPGTYMQWVTEYDVTNISATQPRENMITMGKVDTSDLMMIMTWAIDMSYQSHILKWASWTHITPYIVMKKRQSIELAACTHLRKVLYKHLYVFSACEKSCKMMIMEGSNMSKTEYDPKAIMYSTYDTPHNLCNRSGN